VEGVSRPLHFFEEILMECTPFELPLELFPPRIDGTDPVRTEGIHLTQITKDIMKREGGWDEKALGLSAEIGFMWEEILSNCMKARLPHRIGEIEKDGILMSPDGFDYEEWELWEYKATWKSSKNQPYENWYYMAQVKAYCYAMETDKARMAILYVMGDYKGSGPQYLGYKMRFTDYELIENWEMIVSHARRQGWIK
jgi:hypothetical protein